MDKLNYNPNYNVYRDFVGDRFLPITDEVLQKGRELFNVDVRLFYEAKLTHSRVKDQDLISKTIGAKPWAQGFSYVMRWEEAVGKQGTEFIISLPTFIPPYDLPLDADNIRITESIDLGADEFIYNGNRVFLENNAYGRVYSVESNLLLHTFCSTNLNEVLRHINRCNFRGTA